MLLLPAGRMWAEIFVGRVTDADTKEPLSGVMISYHVTMRVGSAVSNGYGVGSTDSLGAFVVHGSQGINTLTFSLIGYKNGSRSHVCSGNGDTIKLGDIRLKVSDVLLKGAGVKAKRKLFYMRGDTVMYDPKAFNLREGDRIERLLRKLPGVTVMPDGRLLWMGKPIRMILNGQDNDVAAGFLPQISAEAVDKVKVYEKKTEEQRRNGQEGERVLDVKIKKEWMERWYGNASAMGEGGGYYNINANGFHLSDLVPVQVYFNWGDGGHTYYPSSVLQFARINKNYDSEIRQQAFGISGSYTRSLDSTGRYKWTISYSPDLDHRDRIASSFSKSENYLNDGLTNYSSSRSKLYAHNLNIRPLSISGYYYFKDINVNYGLNLSYSKTENHNREDNIRLNSDPYSLTNDPLRHINDNDSLGAALRRIAAFNQSAESVSLTDQVSVRPSVRVWHGLKRGGNLNGQWSMGYTGSSTRDYSLTNTRDYASAGNGGTLGNVSGINNLLNGIDKQHSTMPTHSFDTELGLGYSYSFSKAKKNKANTRYINRHLSFNVDYLISYSQDFTNKRLYRWRQEDMADDDPMLRLFYLPEDISACDSAIDPTNSVRSDLQTLSNKGRISFEYTYDKLTFGLGLGATYYNERLDYRRATIDTIAKRNYALPDFSYRTKYKFSKSNTLSLDATAGREKPQLYQMMPYVNDSRLTYISMGNPNLKDTRNERITLGLSSIFSKWQLMSNLRVDYQRTHNNISEYLTYNSLTGVSTSMPQNIKGGYRWNFSWSFEKLFSSRWRLTNRIEASLNKSYAYLVESSVEASSVINAQKRHYLSDIIKLTFSGRDLEATMHADVSNSHWKNSRGANSGYNYWDYECGVEGKWRFLKNLEAETDINFNGKSGYMSDIMNKNRFLVDAALNYYLFHNKATLTLGVDDLMNEYTNRRYDVSAASRNESSSFSIHHYYYVKFLLNFDGRKNK